MIFFCFSINLCFWVFFGPPYCGIGATIRIGREMLCLPYAGFFVFFLIFCYFVGFQLFSTCLAILNNLQPCPTISILFNNCRTQEGPAYMRLSRFRPYIRPYVRTSVRTSVRTYVRLHIRFQFYPTRSIYLGPPIFLQIPDLLCIDY